MPMDIDEILAVLRRSGGDTTRIEVKSAAGGLPGSLIPTLSALANLPGGGVVVLGLDEKTNFRPVGLTDPQSLKQGLGSRARMYAPPVRLDISDTQVDGQPVILAEVAECEPSAKPCRVASTGKAFLRSYDGDYELSTLEQQGFLAARTPPQQDRQPVAGTTVNDLDADLVAAWRDSIVARGRQGLGRFADDEPELLRRGGVVTATGELTVAGLLTLGTYPQQYLPRMVIQVAVLTGRSGERARNAQAIDGPIPVMLDTTLDWLRTNMGSTTVQAADGRVREVPDYPVAALRELVANALVHRDLAAWANGQAVEIRLTDSNLLIANPGGLYGITIDRLGRDHITSARNPTLVSVCQNARSSSGDERIIEALATGLSVVANELDQACLPPARYYDEGIRFTAMLTRSAMPTFTEPPVLPSPGVSASVPHKFRTGSNRAIVADAIRRQPGQTVAEVAQMTGLAIRQARRVITELRASGFLFSVIAPSKAGRYFPVE